jgi:hypothetical protein
VACRDLRSLHPVTPNRRLANMRGSTHHSRGLSWRARSSPDFANQSNRSDLSSRCTRGAKARFRLSIGELDEGFLRLILQCRRSAPSDREGALRQQRGGRYASGAVCAPSPPPPVLSLPALVSWNTAAARSGQTPLISSLSR